MRNILSELISCKKSNFPNLKSHSTSNSVRKVQNLAPSSLQRRVNSYVEQRNIQQSQPHTPASHPSRPNFAASTFAPLLPPPFLPLLPPPHSAPASASAFCPYFRLCPPILLALPFLAPSLRLSSLLSSPVFVFTSPCFRLCFRAPSSPLPFAPPCAFASAFAPALHPPPPQHHQESPASPPPGNADLNSHPKAIIPSPSERLSPQSPGHARGPSSTPEQPLDCPLFRQFP